jgi:hypothetical protein
MQAAGFLSDGFLLRCAGARGVSAISPRIRTNSPAGYSIPQKNIPLNLHRGL